MICGCFSVESLGMSLLFREIRKKPLLGTRSERPSVQYRNGGRRFLRMFFSKAFLRDPIA
ncbi:hypothetical protein HM1_1345 [Heliomicrobium modesticaldum Ice1]|uniref:Uncharacterized protein n=1 Tax=Heliobacterium modesticaldum (strain ATCC 51547 / Ice1) TaxID=498761 RepID=B0TBT3_HELMI|nr:hypothetical protein HM1_1345 [Heliomicrobium modesticaldum Ice1]